MTPSIRNFPASRRSAFSLVEVVLAVGVVSFAFVAILGLIPAGLQQFRQAMDTSVGAQIAQRVLLDAEQTDFDTLVDTTNTAQMPQPYYFRAPTLQYSQAASPTSPGPCIRYFDEEGNEIVPASTNPTTQELNTVVYYVNTRIMTETVLPQGTSGSSSSSSTGSPDLATVQVQVAFNPGHLALPVYPVTTAATTPNTSCTLNVSALPGVKVRNYSTQVGRNF